MKNKIFKRMKECKVDSSLITTPLKDLKVKKVRFKVPGDVSEDIYVGYIGKKMFLLNHSIHIFPFPSLGMELSHTNELIIDLENQLNNIISKGKLIYHPDIENYLFKEGFIKSDDTIDVNEIHQVIEVLYDLDKIKKDILESNLELT